MAKIKTLKDSGGNSFYPQTHIKGIVDDNGNNLEAIFSEQEKQLDNKIAEHSTVRFDRIEEGEITINAGEIGSTPTAIVYYKPANKFVAADSAGNYWDTWDGMEAYMSGGKIREDKVYLCGSGIFIAKSGELINYGSESNKDLNLLIGKSITDIFKSEVSTVKHFIPLPQIENPTFNVNVELATPFTGTEINIYLKKSDDSEIWIGKIKTGESSLSKVYPVKDMEITDLFISTGTGAGVTFTTTICLENSLESRVGGAETAIKTNTNDIATLKKDTQDIDAKLSTWITIKPFRTDTNSWINAQGEIQSSTQRGIDYYMIDNSKKYLISTDLSGATGVYALHFYGEGDVYLGHNSTTDSILDDVVVDVPEGTTTLAVIKNNAVQSLLRELISSSLSDLDSKISEANSNLSALSARTKILEDAIIPTEKNIVAFGDSLTMIQDDNGKGYIDYAADILGASATAIGIGGSRFSMAEECVFIKIAHKADTNGTVTVSGAVRSVSFNALTTDTINDLAQKLYNAYANVGVEYAHHINGDEVTVRNWRSFANPIDINNVKCETDTGVTIEVRKNKYGMFETFMSKNKNTLIDEINLNLAYANLEIPCMIDGYITGDWHLQMCAAECLDSNGSSGWVGRVMKAASAPSIDKVDTITILGGANNFSTYGAGWGENDSYNIAEMAGGINTIIKRLLIAKPTLKLVFFTTIPKYFGNNLSTWDDSLWCDNYASNKHEHSYPDMVKKVIEIVKWNHIPIFDLYYSMGWNKWNFNQFFRNNDGAHPYNGLEWMGKVVAKHLTNI